MTYALFRCLRQGPRLNSRLSSNHLSALNYDDWQTLASQCTKRLFIKRLEYFDYSRTNMERMVKAQFDAFIELITYRWPSWWWKEHWTNLHYSTVKRCSFSQIYPHQSAPLLKFARPTPRYCCFLYDLHYSAIGALILYLHSYLIFCTA